MKILVPIKRVVDYNLKVRPLDDESDVDLRNLKMSINPFCEIAIEEAIRLKEAGVATEVVAVSIGETKAQEQIRSALAMGADRGILITSDTKLEPLAIAKCLLAVQKKEEADIILMGKQSIDGDNNQTGQMLAALADMPQATFASELKVEDGKAFVTREIDGGLQTLSVTLPAIITTDLRLNEPRYASLPNIMKAKKKPLETIEVAELGVDIDPRVEFVSVKNPPQRSGGVIVKSVEELVEKLKNEARVI